MLAKSWLMMTRVTDVEEDSLILAPQGFFDRLFLETPNTDLVPKSSEGSGPGCLECTVSINMVDVENIGNFCAKYKFLFLTGIINYPEAIYLVEK